jgi:hypothetical protein
MELYRSLLPSSHHELLRRCALLDTFDGDITAYLSPDGNVGLDDLLDYPFIYKVRGQPGSYRLREDIRHWLMESWWEGQPPDAVPPGLSRICADLVKRLEQNPAADDATVVGLLLFVNYQAALGQWRNLYQAADVGFDLLRCRSLIGMLTWMATVSPEVEAMREDFQAYADTRSLWTDEWYRTSSFEPPGGSVAAFESLLRSDSGRMLELRGFGGYGKTTHLRWLIARRCATGEPRIACARIDFDTVDPVAATRDPYLVLLEMADQLDRQLPGDAFGKLVRGHTARRAQLYRRESGAVVPALNFQDLPADQDRSAIAADVLLRFSARLAEMPADTPVVLILDTLEVPLHLPGIAGVPAIKPLLSTLAEAQKKAPSVRIVLAGRYHLDEDLRRLFADRCEPFELPKFTESEALSYLVARRGLPGDTRVSAAVQAADGVPFSLALLADLIEHDPEITASTITAYRGAEYAYLVERVVKRIKEQPVRWVLRYAAIPRRFDYEFVRDVLWPRVQDVISGGVSLDDPADDDLPGNDGGQDAAWQVGGEAPADESAARQVWDQVRRYAGGSSWVRTDDEDRDALRLQTEVVRPLRALLRDKDIVPALHEGAVKYFIRRAQAELPRAPVATWSLSQRDRRSDFLREAVFHRFQLEGQAAGRWWEEQIRAAEDPRDRYALADELSRGTDYTDHARQPTRWGDSDLVHEQTLQRAWLELCLASAELASAGQESLDVSRSPGGTLSDRQLLWQTAADALSRLEATPAASLPTGRMALARAAVTLGISAADADVNDVRRALEEPGVTPRERLWIAILDAQRLVALVSPQAAQSLDEAKKLAGHAPQERDLRRQLAIACVQHHSAWGAYETAISVCVQAVQDEPGDTEFRLVEAMLRITCGDAAGVQSIAETIKETDPAMAGVAALLEAVSLRMQLQFARAAQIASRAIAEAPNEPRLKTWVRGHALTLSGECAAALLQVDDARLAFAEARRVFEDVGDREAVGNCHLQEARLLIRRVGQLRAAGVVLDSAGRVAPDGEMAGLYALLLRAELDWRLEDPDGVTAALEMAKSANRGRQTPPRMALAAVAGLAYGLPRDRDRYSAQLADNLGQVSPAAARLLLLRGIDRGSAPRLQPAMAKRLADQIIPPGGWDEELDNLAPLDRAPLRLGAAALCMMLGDAAGAEQMLWTALTEFHDGDESPAELRKVLQLGRLLGSARVVAKAGPAAVAIAMAHAEEFPLLAAATAIEHVEAARATNTEPWMDPEELCGRAEELLASAGPSAESWSARLAELRSTVGQPDNRIAAMHLKTAARIYADVGDLRRAEQVRNLAPGLEVGSDLGKSRVDVDVTLSRYTIKAKVAGWHLPLPRPRSSISLPLRSAVEEWLQTAGYSPYPPELPDLMLGDWRNFTAAIGDVISIGEVRRRRRRIVSRAEFSIRIHDGILQSLPWELAVDGSGQMISALFRRIYRAPAHDVPNTRLVRVVQASLNRLGYSIPVDGVSGPDTDRALAAWERDSAISLGKAGRIETVQRLHEALLKGATPRALIVRAAASEGRRRNFALERRYARAGIEPYRVEDPYPSALHAVMNSEPPPVVVHIVGGLVATSGSIGIDLLDAGAWGSGRHDQAELFMAMDLDRVLRAVPPNWPSPVVVLEVPLPNGRREAADQLLLRNSYAADLFALGGTQALIGSGLAPPSSIRPVQDVLVEGLARGDAVGDIVQAMRRQGPKKSSRFESDVAFAAIALWTTSPGMRLPILRPA